MPAWILDQTIHQLPEILEGVRICRNHSENGLQPDVARTMAVHTFTGAHFSCSRIKRIMADIVARRRA
ncbi:unnamed protein product [Calypogeia fissa]